MIRDCKQWGIEEILELQPMPFPNPIQGRETSHDIPNHDNARELTIIIDDVKHDKDVFKKLPKKCRSQLELNDSFSELFHTR